MVSWLLLGSLAGALLLGAQAKEEVAAMVPVREPAVAGQFYPGQPDSLRRSVEEFLQRGNEPAPESPDPLALLCPHAGYMYSGGVAAGSYRQVMGKSLDTVIVVSPSHRVPFHGVSIWPRGAYRTPLGLVPVDEERSEALLESSSLIKSFPEAHAGEHALEVQLPFLQVSLAPGWKLVGLVMGSQDPQTAKELAKAIKTAMCGRNFLLVASSDLSHFHSAPSAEEMDRRALRYMEMVDPEGLWAEASRGRVEACGLGPVMTALYLAREEGIGKGELLGYAHSGHVSGDLTRVVGYGAMCWRKQVKGKTEARTRVGVDLGLTQSEKDLLKQIAAQSIVSGLEGKPAPLVEDIPPRLKEPRGAFVTLEKDHRLRGCIGFIQATRQLHETVRDMARAAAFDDPRFPPLRKEEWPKISIEISVLTPLKRIQEVSEIQVGTHGLYVVRGSRRGLLLPQVAAQYGWDREQFLEQTCLKAGLPPDAWKDKKTEIYVFSADVF